MVSEIAERYADGLFELADSNGTVKEKKDQAEGLLEVLHESPDFLPFLQAVKVSDEEKKQFIDNVFGSYLDLDMIHFLKLLVDKGRTYYLREMLEAVIDRCNEALGIQTAVVTSARALSEDDLARIRESLAEKTGKTIVLKNHIDPSVIAGIRVTVGSNVTDITMKKRIDDMREALLKGGLA